MRKALFAVMLAALALAGCLQVNPAPQHVNSSSNTTFVEFVNLVTPDGWVLPAFYYKPFTPSNRSVILVHMLAKSKVSWLSTAEELQRAGFAVLAVDLRGHGESYVNGTRISYEQLREEDYLSMPADLKGFAEFLKSKRPHDRISVVGASLGANLALDYAARDANATAVVMLSPGIEYRGINSLDVMDEYAGRPILMIVNRGDEYSAYSANELSRRAGRGVTLLMLDGSQHGTAMFTTNPELVGQIRDWLLKNG